MSPREQFPRTTCACAACCIGCKTCPGPLIPGDLERIAAHRGLTDPLEIKRFAKQHFCASEGGKYVTIVNGQQFVGDVPTVTPQQRPDGSCVFLEEGRCSIHPVSPFGCSHYDTHMAKEAADERTRASMAAILSSPGYQALRAMLVAAGREARPREERVAAMKAGVLAIEGGAG